MESVTVPAIPALACADAVRGANNINPITAAAKAKTKDGIRIGT